MRVPDPKANTTTKAYLAYKAGYLEESELKPKLYKPDWHFDGWLAYWAGLVNTYPTKENGDPEMLTDEEALVAYLSGVTDTYPEEIKDPYDVRIVGYLKYLVSARFGRPEYPVNNQEFYLSTMKPPVVPSGDTPATNIELDGTAEAPFIDLKMFGDTKQLQTTGDNLLSFPYHSSSRVFAKGVSFSMNEDRTVSLNGQNDGTGNSAYFLVGSSTGSKELPAGKYYFIPPSSNAVEFVMYDGTNYYNFTSRNNYSITFDTDKSIREIYIQVPRNNTTEFDELIVYPMLTTVAGKTEADYVPAGDLTPTPDNPQFVQTVTGVQRIDVNGTPQKIKLQGFATPIDNRAFWAGSGFWAQTIKENGYARFENPESSQTTYGNLFIKKEGVDLTPRTKYTVIVDIADVVMGEGTIQGFTVCQLDQAQDSFNFVKYVTAPEGMIAKGDIGKGWYNNETGLKVGRYVCVLETSEKLYEYGLRMFFSPIPAGSAFETRVMIIEGDHSSDYQTYEYADYIGSENYINLGKNLLKPYVTEGSITKNGVTLTMNDDGTITLNGTSTGDSWITFCGDFTSNVHYVDAPVAEFEEGEPYVLSYEVLEGSRTGGDAYIWAQTYSSNQTGWEKSVKLNTEGGSIALSGDGLYRVWVRTYKNTVYDNMRVGVQVEAGSVKTEFSPYFEPIELCKIDNKQDYIYKEDGEWFVHKEIKKEIFDGTREWKNFRVINTTYNSAEINPEIINGQPKVFCPYFRHINQDNANAGSHIYTFYESNGVKCYFPNTIANSLEEWHTWLSKKNMPIYYPLATPEDIQITNSALISELEALVENGSYNDKTYIETISTIPNLPAGLIVEAAKYA